MLIDGLRDAFALHRCSEPGKCHGCAFSEIARCSGPESPDHLDEVKALIDALMKDPEPIYERLEHRMRVLATHARFEEAAEVRDRGGLLERTLSRAARVAALIAADEIALGGGGRVVVIRSGQLAAAGDDDGDPGSAIARLRRVATATEVASFLTAEQLAEARVISSWIDRHAEDIEILAVSGTWAVPATARPPYRFAETKPQSG
jgi:DNA polymerase-3 subunit epsilon